MNLNNFIIIFFKLKLKYWPTFRILHFIFIFCISFDMIVFFN